MQDQTPDNPFGRSTGSPPPAPPDESLSLSIAHEGREQRMILRRIRPGMTVFDIGAYVGDYAILLSRLVGPTGRVVAIEPSPATLETLLERLAEHRCDNVELVDAAAWRADEEIELHEFPPESAAHNSLGQPQIPDPKNPAKHLPIQNARRVRAIRLDEICRQAGIRRIDFLKLDVGGVEADVLAGAAELLARRAIRVIQFEVSRPMLQGAGHAARDAFAILEQHGYDCHPIHLDGTLGTPVTDSTEFFANYVAMPRLPVNFVTFVLNGQPFIRHHLEQFQQLPFDWHWHIVEGVADPARDIALGASLQARSIPPASHRDGLSIDGTTEYLDQLAREHPDRVTIYRKPRGEFWAGLLEMANRPLDAIAEDGLLFRIDADELWTASQIIAARELFLSDPSRRAAFYWCWFFVGPDRVTSTRHCFGNDPAVDGLRTWRFSPSMRFLAADPPVLAAPGDLGQWLSVASIEPFLHNQTQAAGLVYQHFAYATWPQVQFKHAHQGLPGIPDGWHALQAAPLPALLRDFFPWVHDQAQVDHARHFVEKVLIDVAPPTPPAAPTISEEPQPATAPQPAAKPAPQPAQKIQPPDAEVADDLEALADAFLLDDEERDKRP